MTSGMNYSWMFNLRGARGGDQKFIQNQLLLGRVSQDKWKLKKKNFHLPCRVV